jgi:hypothetical protein
MRKALQSIAIGFSTIALNACDQSTLSLEPPHLTQLLCKPGKGTEGVVFTLDSALRQVTWVNAPGAPKGRLNVTKREYVLELPATAKTQSIKATVNRYDGTLLITSGLLSSATKGGGAPKDGLGPWRCSKQKIGPKL